MIEFLSNYAFTIACTAFVINIIEMILPNGNNGKYVMFVCTVVMTIAIVRPVIGAIYSDFDIKELLDENLKTYNETAFELNSDVANEKIINEYKKNVEYGIVERLQKLGYKVEKIECEYDEITLEPSFLHLEISYDNGVVQPVKIEVIGQENKQNEMSIIEEMKIKKIIEEEYGIKEMEVIRWKNY